MLFRAEGRSAIAGMIVGWLFALPLQPASATHQPWSHVRGTFPNVGILWIDMEHAPEVWQSSDKCKSGESTMRSTGTSQLKGYEDGNTSWGPLKWPFGIDFVKYSQTSTCATTTVDNYTDWHLDYESTSTWTSHGHGTTYGGATYSYNAPSSWCSFWNVPSPCGYHISRTHIWEYRYDTKYSTSYRPKFLLHESGHAMAFFDYCGHTSVSNNDFSCPISSGYQSIDRTMLDKYIYKNSPVYF